MGKHFRLAARLTERETRRLLTEYQKNQDLIESLQKTLKCSKRVATEKAKLIDSDPAAPISIAIKNHDLKLLEAATVDRLYVVLKLRQIVEVGTSLIENGPVTLKNGKLSAAGKQPPRMVDANNACRALQLLGQQLKMFTDTTPINKQERITFNINVQSKDANNGARGTEIDITPAPTGSGTLGAADAANGRFEALGSDSTTRPENPPLPAARAGSSSRTPSLSKESPPVNRLV